MFPWLVLILELDPEAQITECNNKFGPQTLPHTDSLFEQTDHQKRRLVTA